jgi:hypothetical protein
VLALLPVTQVQVISTLSSRKSSALHPAQRTAAVPVSISTKHSWAARTDQQPDFLKYAEQFEHDYDNDDYSNYVEDVSVHTGDSYQSECAMARIYRNELGSFTDRSRPFSVQVPET